jgi:D-glycero-D-manno-heptose 1,7-bisphosphate phosphatase
MPGLLHQIAAHFDASLAGVPVIGDSLRDLQAAASVDARPILVRSGNGNKTTESLPPELSAVEIYDDLAAAVTALLAD